MQKFVPSIVLSGAATLIASYRKDALVIAKEVGLTTDALFSNEIEITGLDFSYFIEHAARSCNERYFGLKMAQIQGIQILGPVWLLMRNAKTVGESLNSLAKNFMLHTGTTAISIEQDDKGGILLCYDIIDDRVIHEEQVIEHGLTLTCDELRTLLGTQWVPQYCQFRYSAPYDLGPLNKVFGENLNFNQDRHAIYITPQTVNQSILAADPEHRQVIGKWLDLKHDTMSQKMTYRTEITIRTLLADRPIKLNEVAKMMAISPRTLQHYLKADSSSFQAIHDKVRLDLAKKYLAKSNLSITAVAERLHFSETAAFTRFFKRLAGSTPKQFSQK